MNRPIPKGWCPSAYQPMASGDGLLVRLKPRFGRFSAKQLANISQLASHYGNSIIDLTSRANFQIRGVSETDYPALLDALTTQNLVHNNVAEEQLNLMISPTTAPHSEGWRCAELLYSIAGLLPELPAKFGFVIDTGPTRLLSKASGDIRLEQAENEGLLLRCEGQDTGFKTSIETFPDDILALTNWVSNHKSEQNRRMRNLADKMPAQWTGATPTGKALSLSFDQFPDGQVIAAAYGHIDAADLARISNSLPEYAEVIILPNRSLFYPDGLFQTSDGFITDNTDVRLNIAACPGAPACASATINTRELADEMAASGLVRPSDTFHVSGCEKGCASSMPRDICITGSEGLFDVIEKGCAWQNPSVTSLSRPELLQWLTAYKEEKAF